jgi:hypothetical protein
MLKSTKCEEVFGRTITGRLAMGSYWDWTWEHTAVNVGLSG